MLALLSHGCLCSVVLGSTLNETEMCVSLLQQPTRCSSKGREREKCEGESSIPSFVYACGRLSSIKIGVENSKWSHNNSPRSLSFDLTSESMCTASRPARSALALHIDYISLTRKQKRPIELLPNSRLWVATGRCGFFIENIETVTKNWHRKSPRVWGG